MIIRRMFAIAGLALTLTAGAALAQNKFGQPKSILHIVTVLWKEDATEAQKVKAVDGVKEMAAKIPGVTNVWVKTVKVQGRGPGKNGQPGRPYDALFVMEFKDQAAFDSYADHPAHRAWEKVYLEIREQSTTHDASN